MSVQIQIETRDRKLIFDIFESDKMIYPFIAKEITDGVSIRLNGFVLRENIYAPGLVSIKLFLAENVALPTAIGVFSAWLYDKLKGRKVDKLYIEGTEVKIDRGEIEKNLIEKVEKEKH
ncbi:MAG: hypothetical protein QW468_05220 [Candidatus Bathyarchaeia archaeon]